MLEFSHRIFYYICRNMDFMYEYYIVQEEQNSKVCVISLSIVIIVIFIAAHFIFYTNKDLIYYKRIDGDVCAQECILYFTLYVRV